MDGDGKEAKHDTSIGKQKSLPPLTQHDMDIMQKADISTGYNCLRFFTVNQFIYMRLSLTEQKWFDKEFRKQTVFLTKDAINKSEKSLLPDSHDPNRRQIKEVEFELQMTQLHVDHRTRNGVLFRERDGFLTKTL